MGEKPVYKQGPACRWARKIGWYSAAVWTDLASVALTGDLALAVCPAAWCAVAHLAAGMAEAAIGATSFFKKKR